MRILTDIPDEDVKKLDELAAREKRSRAAAIRDAVRLYLSHNDNRRDWIDRGYGYWKDRDDLGDGVDYQRTVRDDRRPYEDL